MYAQYFGLRELPFNNTPDPRFFFSTRDHEEALALLIYAVSERKDFALLTGEVGAGKTLVSRMMLRHFGTRISYAIINHTVQDGSDLLRAVCTEFGLPFDPGAAHAQLVRTLHDFLLAQFAKNTPVLLVLDEAQNLPISSFEQLRMIGNLESDNAKLLQTLIVGQPELQQIIATPQLRQLRQRIFRSFHLPALNRENTEGYIRHRLSVAGSVDVDLFDVDAIDTIHAASDGLPRVINTLCDNAMLSAYSADRRRIDGPFMEAVVTQLQWPERKPERVLPRVTHTLDEPVAPPRHAASTRDPHPVETKTAKPPRDEELKRLMDAVQEQVRNLAQRMNHVEQQFVSLASNQSEVVSTERETISQARLMIARVEAACRELHRRELQLGKLSTASQIQLDELNRSLARVERVSAASQNHSRIGTGKHQLDLTVDSRQENRSDPLFANFNQSKEKSTSDSVFERPSKRITQSRISSDFQVSNFESSYSHLLSQVESMLERVK